MLSWAILDQVPPGAMKDDYRIYLSGLVAGALSAVYKMGIDAQPISAVEEHAKGLRKRSQRD